MEERVASSADDPQLQSSRPPQLSHNVVDNNDKHFLQLAPPPGHPLSTYVVQVPKDQIYRVPPPENARLVENYREAAKSSKKKNNKTRLKYLIWIAIVLVVIGILIGVTLTVIYHSFKPQAPVFSVSHLHVQQHNDGSPPTYNVTLKIKNPNPKMGIKYKSDENVDDEDGSTKLIFWTKTLGSGQFPSLYQKPGDSKLVLVKLNGPEGTKVPPNVQRSMNDKSIKHQISLVLELKSPLLMNVWIFKMWSRHLDVKCNFRVNTLGKGTKIVAQHCITKLS